MRNLDCVEIETGEKLHAQAGLDGLALCVEERFDGFEISVLHLDVGGDGHRTEAVVAVRQFGGLAEFLNRVR